MSDNKRWVLSESGYNSNGKFVSEYKLTDLVGGLSIEFSDKSLAEMLLAILNFIGTKMSFKYPTKI